MDRPDVTLSRFTSCPALAPHIRALALIIDRSVSFMPSVVGRLSILLQYLCLPPLGAGEARERVSE